MQREELIRIVSEMLTDPKYQQDPRRMLIDEHQDQPGIFRMYFPGRTQIQYVGVMNNSDEADVRNSFQCLWHGAPDLSSMCTSSINFKHIWTQPDPAWTREPPTSRYCLWAWPGWTGLLRYFPKKCMWRDESTNVAYREADLMQSRYDGSRFQVISITLPTDVPRPDQAN